MKQLYSYMTYVVGVITALLLQACSYEYDMPDNRVCPNIHIEYGTLGALFVEEAEDYGYEVTKSNYSIRYFDADGNEVERYWQTDILRPDALPREVYYVQPYIEFIGVPIGSRNAEPELIFIVEFNKYSVYFTNEDMIPVSDDFTYTIKLTPESPYSIEYIGARYTSIYIVDNSSNLWVQIADNNDFEIGEVQRYINCYDSSDSLVYSYRPQTGVFDFVLRFNEKDNIAYVIYSRCYFGYYNGEKFSKRPLFDIEFGPLKIAPDQKNEYLLSDAPYSVVMHPQPIRVIIHEDQYLGNKDAAINLLGDICDDNNIELMSAERSILCCNREGEVIKTYRPEVGGYSGLLIPQEENIEMIKYKIRCNGYRKGSSKTSRPVFDVIFGPFIIESNKLNNIEISRDSPYEIEYLDD